MCMSSPDIPPPPPPPQETKTADTPNVLRNKRKQANMSGGTLLTTDNGIAGNALNTAAPTLLGS